jgi:PAS domain S-box-containing protein
MIDAQPSSDRIPFIRAAIACLAVVAGYLLLTNLRAGGDQAAAGVEDAGKVLASLFATVCCGLAGRRTEGPMRRAWWLLAMSAGSWTVGQVAWSVDQLNGQSLLRYMADLAFFAAMPLAVAGVLARPAAPTSPANRWRAVLDGAIVATSLFFVAWTFGLADGFRNQPIGDGARLIALVFPFGDLLVVALLVLTLRKSTVSLRAPALLLTAAFAALFAADASSAYAVLGSPDIALGVGWVIGYLLIGLAALWPLRARPPQVEDGAAEPWQLAGPWLSVLVVVGTVVWASLAGLRTDPALGLIGSAIGFLFVLSQALVVRDSLGLLARSRRAEAQLREGSALLSEVFRRAPIGIARSDPRFRILEANPALEALLHEPPGSLVASTIARYVDPEDRPLVFQALRGLMSGSDTQAEGETRLRRTDGSRVWIHWTSTAVRTSPGTAPYLLTMLADVDDRHQADEAAMANLAGLERLNRLKSEFISTVSHEIRTALTGIQGYSELMSTTDVKPDEVRGFAGDINTDALRLNRMITEMLDLDRIESGRMAMNYLSLDLNNLVRGALERAKMTTSNHSFVAALDASIPLVLGDSDRLVQVVTNLLSNAIKYSPDGGEISVTSALHDDKVEVTVTDHGKGIPPEFLGRLFGRYERYEGGGDGKVVGTGLGLAIAQQIIQLHKGHIWVESTVGVGSDFHFTIPVSPAEAEAAAPAADRASPAGSDAGISLSTAITR